MRIIALVVSASALLLVAACEALLAITVARWFYPVAAVMVSASLLRLRPPRQQLGRLLGFAGICLGLAAWHFAPGTSRSAFLERLYSIKPGMTVDKAKIIMAGYKQGTGWPAVPSVDGHRPAGEFAIRDAIVFRHSDDPAYNADWGIVYYRDGRVIRVEFDPD